MSLPESDLLTALVPFNVSRVLRLLAALPFMMAGSAFAGVIQGTVHDTTGQPLPGVTVEAAGPGQKPVVSVTDRVGHYGLTVADGGYQLSFKLINFAGVRRSVASRADSPATIDVTLPLETSASIVVTGKKTFRNLADLDTPVNGLIGAADAASVGVITAKQIEARSEQRPGDVLESIPGVVISQHSGEGKANQYYLRGFNLDHGTDFATTVAGVPVNMPTNAHGQGYSDINFLIPELISGVQYKKGPYYADEGDFASAGAANINYVNVLERPLFSLTGGTFGYQRVLAAASTPWAGGLLLGALELSRNNGPWKRPDDYHKLNGLARFTGGHDNEAYSVTVSAYDGSWNSTDQIPDRAIQEGLVSRFGEIDPSDGGRSHRYSAVGEWQRRGENSLTKANVYGIGYGLDLFSNFTYFLDDPVNGDQFEQTDRRVVAGGRVTHQWFETLFGRSFENLAGVDVRHDDIGNVGLYHTRDRERLDTIRADKVLQTSIGVFAQSTVQWSDAIRAVLGLRADDYHFGVHAGDPANGGTANASLASPKLSIILGPWKSTEAYASAGTGFHSNDGRGSTLTRDPKTGEPAASVDPLVRTKGAEIGLRTNLIPRLQSTVALWGLDINSELVFSGDAGSTEASRPSRRAGWEWSNYYRLSDHLVLDSDLAYSKARFTGGNRIGNRIPGAVEGVISSGISAYDLGRFSGSLRYRYLGPRPLIENNSVRSGASNLVTASLGYAITPRYRVVVEGLNVLDATVSDIDYYYASRLPGEPAGGVNDTHLHPIEPRAIRIRVEMAF
jgi:hypothetical protein